MSEVVHVSAIENEKGLMAALEEYFKKGRYAEITQAIGMHSLLIDPQHTMTDQARLYRAVLNMLKNKIAGKMGKTYALWYADFPKSMDRFVTSGEPGKNDRTREVLLSRHEAYGPFKSVDDFYFWALDERRLTLEQIAALLEKSSERFGA
jgi:hypothetical protein